MAHLLSTYLALINRLGEDGFHLGTIVDHFDDRMPPPAIYLRHDVDRLPGRAVAMAEVEMSRGVFSTYYFRCNPKGQFPGRAIERVAALGHEVGFHYECLSRAQGDVERALDLFERDLAALRGLAAVHTVAPHGAPASAYSNMEFTRLIRLHDLALIGDASAIDFTDILYITDTGGTFGSPHNLRDRTDGPMLAATLHPRQLAAHLRQTGTAHVVLSCHPERWPERPLGLLQATARDLATNAGKAATARLRRLAVSP